MQIINQMEGKVIPQKGWIIVLRYPGDKISPTPAAKRWAPRGLLSQANFVHQ